MTRVEDYVLFTGADVPSLIGTETADLHLYVCGKNGLAAVPFQADKRDVEGRLVFPDETMRDPLRDGTLLDENDELVFMVKDAGGRCRGKARVEGAHKGVELELIDPLDQGRAWAYLFDRKGFDPPPTEDYVGYRLEEGYGEYYSTDLYVVGQPMGELAMTTKLRKPDGSWGEDVLEGQNIGASATLLNGTIPMIIPEQVVKCRTFGVIDGPVRVVKDEMDFIHVKAIGMKWSTEYFLTFYQNGNISPVEVNVPVNLHKLFLDFSFYWSLILDESILGSTFKNPANPEGFTLDGKADSDIDDKKDNSYNLVTGPQGSMIDAMFLDEQLGRQMVRTTMVREDFKIKDLPDGQPPLVQSGFRIKTQNRLSKGNYNYWFYHYYPYPFTDNKPQEILNIVEHPVQVNADPLSPPDAVP